MKKAVNSEIANLEPFLNGMPRSKKQFTGLNESDAEVIKLSANSYLATSIDSVSEEWVYGLYRNHETLAWLAVQGTLSDLVACGVKPEGFLFSPLWKLGEEATARSEQKKLIFDAVRKSLRFSKVPLLGGDQGEAASLSLTGVALGVSKQKPLSRIGMKPGDYLCLVGELGIGPALGFRYLLKRSESELPEDLFRPVAHVEVCESLLTYANAAMDTSDGFCSTLHQLGVLNGVSFEIDFSKIKIAKEALEFCRLNDLPPLSLCFGEHGDYQILFSVSPKNLPKIQKKIKKLQVVGTVNSKSEKQSRVIIDGKTALFNPSLLANLPKNTLESLEDAFRMMLESIRKMEFKDV